MVTASVSAGVHVCGVRVRDLIVDVEPVDASI
jgi:hypothetical protein